MRRLCIFNKTVYFGKITKVSGREENKQRYCRNRNRFAIFLFAILLSVTRRHSRVAVYRKKREKKEGAEGRKQKCGEKPLNAMQT